jgi:hypothetical protein
MRSSELLNLLESGEEMGALRAAIGPSMPDFRAGISLRGASAPVRLETEGKELPVTELHIRRICEEYLAERLDEEEVAYLATAIELCPDFKLVSEVVEETVSVLSDPVANGPLSRALVERLLGSL